MALSDRVLAAYKRSMAVAGEDIAVRRYSGSPGARTHVDTTVRARPIGFQPKKLAGSTVEGQRKVIALVDTLGDLLPLTTSDKLVVRGEEIAIKGVDDNTRRVGGVLIALEIQVAG